MAKLSFSDVTNFIIEKGGTLISTEYTNLDTEMEFACSRGHKVFTTFKKFRINPTCPTCQEEEIKVNVSVPCKKASGTIRVLALDNATETTGGAIFDDGELITYGKFQTTKENTIERIAIVRQGLLNMIAKGEPDKVGVEDIQLQSFGDKGKVNYAVTTYKVLAQLQGVILEVLFSHKVDSIVVHSQTGKAYCEINQKNRSDQKRAAQMKVNGGYHINVTQDEADAICMGKYISQKYIRNNTIYNGE